MRPDFLTMAPFNALFCITFAAFIVLLIVVSLIMRKRSDKAKRASIAITAILTFIGFFVYKYFISIDKEYDAITQNMGGFNWWGELPLHLCNINIVSIKDGRYHIDKDLAGAIIV